MKKMMYLLFSLILCKGSMGQVSDVYKVSSPDKTTSFETGVNKNGILVYRMLFEVEAVTAWSELGITLPGSKAGEKTVIRKQLQRSNKEQFAWPLGEDDMIRNHYREMIFSCHTPSLHYDLIARVYNGSIAFRYQLPESGQVINTIKEEQTSFNFTEPYTLFQYNLESVFLPVSIDTLNKTCDLPATLTNGKLYISVGEAANDQFTKAELKRGFIPHSLVVAYVRDSVVKLHGPMLTPWRTISVSKTAIRLQGCERKKVEASMVVSLWCTLWNRHRKGILCDIR